MKLTFSFLLMVAALASSTRCNASTTFGVQYELSGVWIDTGGGSQSFSTVSHGASSSSGSYSESIPYQFVCYFPSTDSIDEPIASGSATVNMTEQATAAALIIGSTGTATGHAVCGGQTANASKSSGGSQSDISGPTAISGFSVSGSDLIWDYDSAHSRWIGYWPLVTEAMNGTSSFTAQNGGDFRDQASGASTVAPGSPSLISGNTITVI